MKQLYNYNPLKVIDKSLIESITPIKYEYQKKYKIVTYVPLAYVDKLTFDMGNAGAGIIGNYDLCSFRMKGLGTYRPLKNAKPFKGEEGKISFEEEVRLEMECESSKLDNVIEALLENHPYEEVAYEVYEFMKREKNPKLIKVTLKQPIKLFDLIKGLKKEIREKDLTFNQELKNILLGEIQEIDEDCLKLASKSKCNIIISVLKNKIIFKKV
ncbi:MAG: hypothetical protein N2490_01585 [Ignavibacteria bacterium]|nr:hypothetical protein [Ignavibacteria bacterium]